MKKYLILLLTYFLAIAAQAQQQTPAQLHETAKTFLKQGDYANAILVLNRALEAEPQNMAMQKDLALTYYYQKDNRKAAEVVKPLLDRDDADDQVFQIAGNIYMQLQDAKEAEKAYRKGLKKYPNSGPLFNDLGELQWALGDYEAIRQWEKGIEVDPSFSRNYYNAARFYAMSTEKTWSLLYAEIFLNMEPRSTKAPEMKQLLLDNYKKLFTETDLEKSNKGKNDFVKHFLRTMNKQSSVAAAGIDAGTLTMIRTRFVLDWFNNKQFKHPYRLFEYHQQLLKEGMFDAYNQWLFGPVQDLASYQNWTSAHSDEQQAFNDFQKSRIFKIPAGQYYNN